MPAHHELTDTPTTRRLFVCVNDFMTKSRKPRIELHSFWADPGDVRHGLHVLNAGRVDSLHLFLTKAEAVKAAEAIGSIGPVSGRFGTRRRYRADIKAVHGVIDTCGWSLNKAEQRIVDGLDELAGRMSRAEVAAALGVPARQLRLGHGLVMSFDIRRKGPRLDFYRNRGDAWTLEVRCADAGERSRLLGALDDERFYPLSGHESVARDVAFLRGRLIDTLGWELTPGEEQTLQRASVARVVEPPFYALEIVQERPGGRVYFTGESVRRVCGARMATA